MIRITTNRVHLVKYARCTLPRTSQTLTSIVYSRDCAMDLSVRPGSPAAPIKTEISDVEDVRGSPDASVTRLSRTPSPSPVKRERSLAHDNDRTPNDPAVVRNPFLKLFPQLDARTSAPAFPAMPHGPIGGELIHSWILYK